MKTSDFSVWVPTLSCIILSQSRVHICSEYGYKAFFVTIADSLSKFISNLLFPEIQSRFYLLYWPTLVGDELYAPLVIVEQLFFGIVRKLVRSRLLSKEDSLNDGF